MGGRWLKKGVDLDVEDEDEDEDEGVEDVEVDVDEAGSVDVVVSAVEVVEVVLSSAVVSVDVVVSAVEVDVDKGVVDEAGCVDEAVYACVAGYVEEGSNSRSWRWRRSWRGRFLC